MRAKKRKPAKGRRVKKAAVPVSPVQPGLDALNRGLFGAEEAGAGREAGASVQDPLEDWPETKGEEDRWILERGAQER